MNDMEHSLIVLLVGVLIASAILLKWSLGKTILPPLLGYLAVGFLLKLTWTATGFLTESTHTFLEFLADIGVVVLLFRVGLESNLAGLVGQFRHAQGIWLGNVLFSGFLGFAASKYLLDWSLITSLYITVSLTATSVAVPVALWKEADALDSDTGELLLDVAELDDISAVLLMSLLFAVVPVLERNAIHALLPTLLKTGGWLFVKLLLFGGFCYVFSRTIEKPLTRFFGRIKPMPDPMLLLTATGFVIAALAGFLGFSIALGAFFAGVIFSRDSEATTLSRPFVVLYELFTPFFFISIGLSIDPQAVTFALIPGAVLLAAAVVGKFVGTVLPARRENGWTGSLLLGMSMIPRAEISMIVMRHGRQFGESVVPEAAYAAMVMVSAATCIISPVFLRPMLERGKVEGAAKNLSGDHITRSDV